MNKESKEKNVKKKGKVKGKKKKNIFLRVVLILILIIIIAAGILLYKRYKEEGWSGVSKTILGHNEETVNKLEKMYCLLLGKSQELTDTIMLASYDPKTQEAALLSIPRDTFIGDNLNYASGWDKINSVYQISPDDLLEHVRNITGINVQYYLTVDTEALKALVDEIGGVYFDVPIDMHYTDRGQGLYIDLQAGYQLLDGDKAEQLVRFRHNSDGTTYPYEYGGEDLGRMRTQREFLKELLKQCIQKMDINTILGFLDIAQQYVETNLNFNAIKDYIPYILEFNIDNLKTATLPGQSMQAGNGLWIYTVDETEAQDVINELFYGITPTTDSTDGNTIDDEGNVIDSTTDTLEEPIRVEVLNGSGSSSNLSEVIGELEASGFEVVQTGNTSTTSNTTIIDRNNASESALNILRQILDVENITTGESSESRDITIIIGTDYVM